MNTYIPDSSATGFSWFKSSYSSSGNQCVESAKVPGMVPVRDSKSPHGPALAFSPDTWSLFVRSIKEGEFGI
ncbi:DUF397 domain-containing protein [Streptomyces iconiensis]|uniref:DUF397 domain-containing protein n=1 Tax=Streptomyces iconiensis TaxID=1384038 RepID=A0ABT6ZWU7_9ACTN|nr:DUF397 domain-containing protein [Streptomyces iconiensis]MDJ1133545.1 DUF397 domain-containing protein [Streptomyces iconiensis]